MQRGNEILKEYQFNQDLVRRYSGNTLMVYNEKSGEIYELNSVAADIFEYLAENKAPNELLDWIQEKYQISEQIEEVSLQIKELLNRFISCGIIIENSSEM